MTNIFYYYNKTRLKCLLLLDFYYNLYRKLALINAATVQDYLSCRYAYFVSAFDIQPRQRIYTCGVYDAFGRSCDTTFYIWRPRFSSQSRTVLNSEVIVAPSSLSFRRHPNVSLFCRSKLSSITITTS